MNLISLRNKCKNKNIRCTGVFIVLLSAVVYIGLGITGCQNVDKYSNYQIFNYNEDASVTTLDPAYARSQSEIWLVSQLYNGLIDLDSNLKPVPGIAKKWSVEDGGKRIRFTLKKNIRFCIPSVNNSSKETLVERVVRAEDVVASLQRVANPANSSPGLWIFANVDTVLQHAFVAVDDSTVDVNLLKPQASLISLFATNYCFIMPAELAVKDKGYVARNPMGTGPFYLRRWEEEIQLVMRKNPYYHEKDSKGVSLPYLDAVNVSFVKNKQTAFMQFVAGKYDFFNGLEGSFKDELITQDAQLKPKYAQRFKLLVTPFLNTEYIGCYIDPQAPQSAWLRNENFRNALHWAIDKKRLVKFIRNGLGTPAYGGFVPDVIMPKDPLKGNPLVANSPVILEKLEERSNPYRPENMRDSALKYLRLSGYLGTKIGGSGSGLRQAPIGNLPRGNSNSNIDAISGSSEDRKLVLTTTTEYLDMAIFLQKSWEEIGVKVDIDIQTGAMLRQKRNEGQLQLFRGSWIADYPEAESYLACFYSKYWSPNGPNYTHYLNPAFDALFEQVEQGGNPEAVVKANAMVKQSAVVFPLYYDKSLRLYQNWVSGLGNDANNRLILKKVKVKR